MNTAPAFALMAPANGNGPTHLALIDGPAGFMCETNTGRKLYRQMGITGADAGSCPTCRREAVDLEAAADAAAARAEASYLGNR